MKNSDHVVCDSIISFSVFNRDGASLPKKFVLKALVNHVGTIVNGHYTAIVKDRNEDRWFHCDDRTVLPCRKNVFNSASVYLLFYEEVLAESA